MSIRIIKYSELKRKKEFQDKFRKMGFGKYRPKKSFKLNKEKVFPIITRTGTRFVFIGGFISVFGGVILLFLKLFYTVKENLTRIIPGKVVEIRVKE